MRRRSDLETRPTRTSRLAGMLALLLACALWTHAPAHATDHGDAGDGDAAAAATGEAAAGEAAADAGGGEAAADAGGGETSIVPEGEAMTPDDTEVAAKPWDQAEVTTLVKQLADELGDVREAHRRVPNTQMGVMRARHSFDETMRLLRDSTRRMARKLEDGAGLEETRPMARNIGQLIRAAEDDGKKAALPKPVLDKIELARATIAKIRPYYAAD